MVWDIAESELLNELFVALDVLALEVGQKALALADHRHQAGPGVVVLLELAQVVGELADAFGQQGDLNFGRTGVLGAALVGVDDAGLFFFRQHGILSP
jgi:hypothetical protein